MLCVKVVRRNLSEDVKNKENCLVKISGEWYDIAPFMDQHPGGDILKEFVGKDITVMYRLWHPTYVFNNPDKFVKKVDASKITFLSEPSSTPTPSIAPTHTGSDSDSDAAHDSLKKNLDEIFGRAARCGTKFWYTARFWREFERKWRRNAGKMLANFGF
jgi:hypothetical protein